MTRFLSLLVIGLSFPGIVLSQEPPAERPPRPVRNDDSLAIWKSLFHFQGMKAVSKITDPENSVLVIVERSPESTPNRQTRALIQQMLQRKGGVLIVSNQFRTVGQYFALGQQQDALIYGRVRDHSLNTPEHMLVRTQLVRDQDPLNRWFGSLERVVTGDPAAVRMNFFVPWLQGAVGGYPRSAVVQVGENFQRTVGVSDSFAIGGVGKSANPYRLGIVADPELFTNRMLLTSGAPEGERTDNFLFAHQTVKWLQGSQAAKECLFLEDYTPEETLDYVDWAKIPASVPPVPPPIPSIDPWNRDFQAKAANLIDTTIVEAENRRLFDNALTGGEKNNRRFFGLLITLAVLACIFFLVLTLRRSYASRLVPEFQPIPRDPLRLGEGVVPGSLEHRQIERERNRDLAPPIVQFLQIMFEKRGGPSAPQSQPGRPRFTFSQRKYADLAEDLRMLWDVAYGPPRVILFSRWKMLEPIITRVNQAAESGYWQITRIESGERA